ncbi:MAG: type II toxin-antitoxin system HicA family toxin [bacterium]
MTPREIEKRIKDVGWRIIPDRGKGSHRQYRHEKFPGIITIPWHGQRDLPPGTLNSILKTAGLK